MRTNATLAILLFPLVLLAQAPAPSLLSGDKHWTMLYKGVLAPEYGDRYGYIETRLEGDTVIGGIHFKRKYRRSWHAGEPKPQQWEALNEYLGQDDGKVYIYKLRSYGGDWYGPQVIMDFYANVGDTVRIGTHEEEFYTVSYVRNGIVASSDDKAVRRFLMMQYDPWNCTDVWIDGIGSLYYGVDSTVPGIGAIPHLYRCTDGDTVLYQYEFTPEGIQEPYGRDSTSASSPVFDLQGRPLPSQPSWGVYIREGRKYVRK